MSLKHEQYMSLMRTRELLYDMLNGKYFPKTRREQRELASRCLRHFPVLKDTGEPVFSADNFPCDSIEEHFRPRKDMLQAVASVVASED